MTGELARALALTRHAIGQALVGRRRIGVGLLALTPLAIALALQQLAPGNVSDELEPALLLTGVGLVVPLIALFLGASVLRDDVTSGAIVHVLTRPVRRETVALSRLAGAAGATILVGLVAVTLPLIVLGSGAFDTWRIAVQGTVLAGAAYGSLFAMLGALVQRATLVGLVFLVAWEGVVASTGLFFRNATVAYWLRSFMANGDSTGSDAVAETLTGTVASTQASLAAVLAVVAGAALVAALWFARREFAGPEPET